MIDPGEITCQKFIGYQLLQEKMMSLEWRKMSLKNICEKSKLKHF